MNISDFINNEDQFKGFSLYDCQRNLPSIIDGMKPSQRKVLWTAVNNKKRWKVSSLASVASDYTHYQHGSLSTTIIGMAQDYPNSNNYPLLEKEGQFGTRLDKNGASADRYIYVSLHKNAKLFFNDTDFELLPENVVDGDVVEPKFLMPLVPLVLLNNSVGIGTGFAVNIVPYHIRSIKKAIKEYIECGDIKTTLKPFLNGFMGDITVDGNTITFTGVMEIINTTNIVITDIPPTFNNESYKALLNKLIEKKMINDYENYSKESEWKFVINCPRSTTRKPHDQLISLFGLKKNITQNFTLWDENGYLSDFGNVYNVIKYWVDVRLKWVEKRKKHLICKYNKLIAWNEKQAKFIEYWNTHSKELIKMSKKELVDIIKMDITPVETEIDALLKKPIVSLTKENRESFLKKAEDQKNELHELETKTITEIYLEDLK